MNPRPMKTKTAAKKLSSSERPTAIHSVLSMAFAVAFLAALAPAAFAQQPPPSPCENDTFRQFDFWVGEWNVTQKDGSAAGTNTIEKILNSCALQENWTGVSGSIGKSFNHYDYQHKEWRQTWVDGGGGRLDLVGCLEGKSMVMRGERPSRQGEGTVLNEIKWTPTRDGSVEQHWRVSTDGGKTWNDAFFGIYRRK